METVVGLAEAVIRATDWPRLREACGSARGVGVALSDLLAAPTPEAAREAYWRLENHVVSQGELFEVAEACVTVLVAAFAEERPRHVRICALELLFQILSGAPSMTVGTPGDLRERCQQAAREHLWTLVREAVVGEREAAWEVIELAALGDSLESVRVEVNRARESLKDKSL